MLKLALHRDQVWIRLMEAPFARSCSPPRPATARQPNNRSPIVSYWLLAAVQANRGCRDLHTSPVRSAGPSIKIGKIVKLRTRRAGWLVNPRWSAILRGWHWPAIALLPAGNVYD